MKRITRSSVDGLKTVMKYIKFQTVKQLFISCLMGFLAIAPSQTKAQWKPDTISAEEMILQFRNYKAGIFTDSLEAYDALYPASYFGEPSRLAYDKNLHKAENLKLPRSAWSIVVRDSMVKSTNPKAKEDFHKISYLCWHHFLENPKGVDTLALRKKLEKRYGQFTANGRYVGIPAKWFTGDMMVYKGVIMYAGTPITADALEYRFESGVFRGSQARYQNSGSLRNEIIFYHANYNLNDRSWMRGYNKQELLLFHHDINRSIPKDTSSVKFKPCDILIYSDSQGKSHMRPVYPELLLASDTLRMQGLKKAVEEQPANIFGVFYTPKAEVFTGRYLRAYYGIGLHGYGEWFFEDSYLKAPQKDRR